MGQTVYLSGPIAGKAFADADSWRFNVAMRLQAVGYAVLSPTARERGRHEDHPHDILGPSAGFDLREAIELVNRDEYDVRTVDIVLVNLELAERVSIGTVAELSWAHMLNKHIVLVLPDGAGGLVHQHPFVEHQASVRFQTLKEAENYLIELAETSRAWEELPWGSVEGR